MERTVNGTVAVGVVNAMDAATALNVAIDRMKNALDEARAMPEWAVVLVVLLSLLSAIILLHVLALTAAAPCLWALWKRRTRQRRDRLLEEEFENSENGENGGNGEVEILEPRSEDVVHSSKGVST